MLSKIESRSFVDRHWVPRAPKRGPRAPQGHSRAAQEHPRAPQERPRAPQGRPRAPQERPKGPQERPKGAQERPKIAPRVPKIGPKWTPRPPQRRSPKNDRTMTEQLRFLEVIFEVFVDVFSGMLKTSKSMTLTLLLSVFTPQMRSKSDKKTTPEFINPPGLIPGPIP